MGKRKLKILLHRVRETKELWMVLHIKVYRKEERNFTAVHLFNGAKFVWFWLLLPLIRYVFVCKIWLELFCFWRGITLGFTASWRAVLRAWLSVYSTPASSAFSLPRHRIYTRFLLRSFAWRSCLGCRWFFRACSCIPTGLNSQCHRQSRTKSGGVINFSGSMDYSYTLFSYDENGKRCNMMNFLPLCRAIIEWVRSVMDFYLK